MRSSFYLTVLLSVASLGILSGCKSLVTKPSLVPKGYTYHKDLYKSPPPGMADEIGYTYSPGENEEVLSIWRPKIAQLVDMLEQKTNMEGQSFYIRGAARPNAQNMTFDHLLRDELSARGYTIISDRYEGMILGYDIIDPDSLVEGDTIPYQINDSKFKDVPDYKPALDYQDMILELSLSDKTAPVTSVGGVFTVPMFGARMNYGHEIFKPVSGQKSIGAYDARKEL